MAVAVEFATIPEMFPELDDQVRHESRPVLMYKSGDTYKGITYAELANASNPLPSDLHRWA